MRDKLRPATEWFVEMIIYPASVDQPELIRCVPTFLNINAINVLAKEIDDFVEFCFCKVCVMLRSRVARGFYLAPSRPDANSNTVGLERS